MDRSYEMIWAYPAEGSEEHIDRMRVFLQEHFGDMDEHEIGETELAYPIRFKFDRKYYSKALFFKHNMLASPEKVRIVSDLVFELPAEPLRFFVRKVVRGDWLMNVLMLNDKQ